MWIEGIKINYKDSNKYNILFQNCQIKSRQFFNNFRENKTKIF